MDLSRTGVTGAKSKSDVRGDAEQLVKRLKKFADDDSIKAIILHVNTPGGGAAASEEITREVRRIRIEKKKHRFSIRGILVDSPHARRSETLESFADEVRRVSDLASESMADLFAAV